MFVSSSNHLRTHRFRAVRLLRRAADAARWKLPGIVAHSAFDANFVRRDHDDDDDDDDDDDVFFSMPFRSWHPSALA